MNTVPRQPSSLQRMKAFQTCLERVSFKLKETYVDASWSEPYKEWPDHPDHMRRTMGRMHILLLAMQELGASERATFRKKLNELEGELRNLSLKVLGPPACVAERGLKKKKDEDSEHTLQSDFDRMKTSLGLLRLEEYR